MSFLAILFAATAATADAPASEPIDCKAERIALMRMLKPIVDPRAVVTTPEDGDPSTVQLLVVEGLALSEGRVSPNGQIIILPLAATVGPEANELIGAKLLAQAVDNILAQKVGDRCEPLQVGPAGT